MKNYLFYNGNKEKIKQEICNIIPEPDRTDILNEGLSLENILEECGGPEDFFIDEKYNFNNLFVNFEPEGRSPKISFYVNGEKLLIIQGDIYRKFVSECNSPDIFVNYNINQKYINTICNENEREEYIEKVNKLLKLTHLYNYDLICVSAEDFMF